MRIKTGMLMAEADGQQSSGGVLGTGGSQTTPPTTEPPKQDTFVAPEWAKGLTVEQEILSAPVFKSVKSLDDVVKGYYHAQKLVGADKVVVPNKSSSPDEWRNYYVKAGLPESVDKYAAKLPESFNDDQKKQITELAYNQNIRPDQLEAVINHMDAQNKTHIDAQTQGEVTRIEQLTASLQKEWGNDYQPNLQRAQTVIKTFGGPEMLEQVLNSPLANDERFLKLMVSVGKKLTSEDTFKQEVVQQFGMSKEDAQAKINAIYANPAHAYFDDAAYGHKQSIQDMLKLQEIVSSK